MNVRLRMCIQFRRHLCKGSITSFTELHDRTYGKLKKIIVITKCARPALFNFGEEPSSAILGQRRINPQCPIVFHE